MKVVVIGGCTEALENGCLSCCEVFEDDGNSHILENVLKTPRRGAAVCTMNNNIFVFGGASAPGNHEKTIEKIDPCFNSTMIDCELEEESSCFAYCKTKEDFLIVGGFNGLECLNTASLFSPVTSQMKSFKIPTRLKNAAACESPWNPKAYLLFGGWDESRTLQTIFILSLDDFGCSMEEMLPYCVEGHTATLVDSFILIIGGYNGVSVIPTIAKYDQNGTHIMDVQLEVPRENHCTAYLRSTRELLVIGGWNDNGNIERLPSLSLKKPRQKSSVVVID